MKFYISNSKEQKLKVRVSVRSSHSINCWKEGNNNKSELKMGSVALVVKGLMQLAKIFRKVLKYCEIGSVSLGFCVFKSRLI